MHQWRNSGDDHYSMMLALGDFRRAWHYRTIFPTWPASILIPFKAEHWHPAGLHAAILLGFNISPALFGAGTDPDNNCGTLFNTALILSQCRPFLPCTHPPLAIWQLLKHTNRQPSNLHTIAIPFCMNPPVVSASVNPDIDKVTLTDTHLRCILCIPHSRHTLD